VIRASKIFYLIALSAATSLAILRNKRSTAEGRRDPLLVKYRLHAGGYGLRQLCEVAWSFCLVTDDAAMVNIEWVFSPLISANHAEVFCQGYGIPQLEPNIRIVCGNVD